MQIYYFFQQKLRGISKPKLFIQLCFIFLLIFVFYKFFFSPPPPPPPPRPSLELDAAFLLENSDSILNQFRACSNLAFNEKKNAKDFIVRFRQCIYKFIPNYNFDKFFMGRMNEYKIFLPLKTKFDQTKCIWLTVGVGGTDNAEKEFKNKYPECKVFGIEPSSSQYVNFDKYGTIIPYGVGVTNGTFELFIREPSGHNKKQVYVLAMADILDKYIGSRLVHYMTIDIEGFEYTILKELLKGKVLAEQGIVFCQIDAELHGPNKNPAANILHEFDSESSDYLPIYTQELAYHEKVTWINIKNEECRNAFDIETLLE